MSCSQACLRTDETKNQENQSANDLLEITPLKTDKSKIKTTANMDSGVIPKHPCSVLLCGKSGSGKTNLLASLLMKPQFYKGFFDLTFLFSETAHFGGDDLYEKHLEIPEDHMFKPDKDGIAQLDHIVKTQKKIIKDKGISKAPRILIIFDDLAHSRKFLDSNQYLLLHIANRHLNISSFSLMQSYVKMPRSCRCQVSAVFFFHGGTNTEKDRLSEEHTPSNHDDKEFLQIINHATADKYNFLYVNKQMDMKQRYRKNLGTILELKK